MKKIQLSIAAAAFLLLACNKAEEKKKNALGDPDVIAVKVASVSAFDVPDVIQATGLISTENQTNYAFKIGGLINRIYVEEGQFFRKGQLLATLNATEISAGLAQVGLSVDKAQRDYTRASNLYKDSVFTLEQLQNTLTALEVAKKAKEATAFDERYSRIYAASDGFVSKKTANEGEIISGGMPVLLTNSTEQNGGYLLKVGVTDREWSAIQQGQAANVTLDGYPGQIFMATVLRKLQTADMEIGSFQIELKLTLDKVIPAIGMFGKAEITTGRQETATAIPYASLVEADGDKAYVFTPVGTDKVKRMPVTILRFDNQNAYIKERFNDNDKIVISNSAYLNERSTIKIIR